MIPIPHCCLVPLDIKTMIESGRQRLVMNELAACRKNRDAIFKHAMRTYSDVITYTKNQLKTVQKIEHNLAYMDYAKIFCLQFYWLLVLHCSHPENNSCDFLLLEKAYHEYLSEQEKVLSEIT
ncbi:MAG: type III toxin-antitoxin system ToxN/AbiQ family toxin [Oscillospiraceae bacterium]|nr:type III toxin-antitoxin system ToxN/AbiQ family toxin [Oscillospiraceae bacterium]